MVEKKFFLINKRVKPWLDRPLKCLKIELIQVNLMNKFTFCNTMEKSRPD